MIKNLIWDLDGTLFDTYPAFIAAFVDACATFGAQVDPAHVEALVRIDMGTCVSGLSQELGVSEDELGDQFDVFYKAYGMAKQAPFPGLIDVLDYVRSIGGANAIITHRRAETTAQILDLHRLADRFVDRITGDDGYPRKPAPAAFIAMRDRHGFRPEETLCIGDRDIDTLAAHGAGLRACIYGAPEAAEPDLVVTDYADLLAYLQREAQPVPGDTPTG